MSIESIADTIKPKRASNSPLPMPDMKTILDLFYVDDEWRLIHKKRRFGVTVGSAAGNTNDKGYIRTKICGKYYLNHRIIFYINTGIDPIDREVDHIDGNPRNNNPSNLRLATHGQNQQNGRCYRNNGSKLRGVHWHKQHRKFCVSIQKDNKRVHVGLYKNKTEAALAYNKAAIDLFGEFARLNEV